MKRSLFILSFLFILTSSLKSQVVQIVNETFEGTLSGWTINPFSSWKADTNLYVSEKTSYKGSLLATTNPGDTVVITSPVYNLESYGYVWLTFSHICKVLSSDICQIEYREDHIGSTWTPIPGSSYKGNGFYTNTRFSQDSYLAWQPNDSLATPNNGWWKTEQFNVSDEASFAKMQFRFKITRGSALGSYFVYGWLIDNFQIHASVNPIAPPVLEILTTYEDTVYQIGPFPIKAKVATQTIAPLLTPKLYYSATIGGVTTHDSIAMTAIEGDSMWTATIPQHVYGTSVIYSIVAYDSVGNTNSVNGGFYLKRGVGANVTSYTYYQPADTTGSVQHAAIVFHATQANSWSRSLFLASEIGASSKSLSVASLSWYNRTYNYSYLRTHLNVYMKCTTATSNTNLVYEDPTTNGATLVYSGPTTTSLSWNEIKLQQIFDVIANSNLMIYFEDSTDSVSGAVSIFWAGHAESGRTVYQYGTVNIAQSPSVPLMRFGLGSVIEDSNSVALYAIEHPSEHVIAGQTTPIVTTIKNRGYADLDSCIIRYSINGVVQTPFYWTGNLPDDFNSTDTIGSYVPRLNQYDTLVVWVSMPNGVVDSATQDDSLTLITYGCQNIMSGNYVIGSGLGADFSNYSEFMDTCGLCGVNGNITLNLQNGTYTENWNFTNLADIMVGHTLTITSLSGNRDSVILKPTSGVVGITLNKTDNLIIKDITVDNTSSVAYGVQFTGAATNVEFRNIHFIGNKTGTTEAATPAPIYKANATGVVDDVRFIGNTIEGGYHGIYFYGGTAAAVRGSNVVFDSNIVLDQHYYATYFFNTNFLSVSHNTLHSKATVATIWHGLYFSTSNVDIANANKIHAKKSFATFHGIFLSTVGSSSTPSLLSNNEIIGITTGVMNGINGTAANVVNLYNNSVHMSGTGASRCMYFAANAASNYDIKNNILVQTGGAGHPIYFGGTIIPFTSDYNCLYGNTYVGYYVAAQTSLSSWQSATSQDANSISVNPSFVNATSSLELSNYIGLNCNMQPNVDQDIQGTARMLYTPMGCYTTPLVDVNGAIVEILNVETPAYTGDTSMLEVILLNAGLDTINTATINWSIDGVSQSPIYWNGSLSFREMDTLALGTIVYKSGYNYVKVWLSGLGSLIDGVSYDDTLEVYTFACLDSLSGDFIVGTSPGADFPSISDALSVASMCGVIGNVTLKLQNGMYDENWDFANLADIMVGHTLTITSLSGNRDSVILKSTSGVGIILKNTDNLIVKDITVNNASGVAYGVQFTGAATHVEFRNIHFIGNKTGTAETTSRAPIYKANATGVVDDVRFIGNTIEGGFHGIYFYGGTTLALRGSNVVFDSNIVFDQYNYATYFFHTNFLSVSHNTLHSKATVATIWYGLYFTTSNFDIANANKIHAKKSFATFYGIYLNTVGNSATPSSITNNEIIGITTGAVSGINGTGANVVNIYNNSVHMSGTAGASRCMYFATSTTSKYDIKNNILVHAGSGYPIFFQGMTTPFTSDYNCLYGNTFVGSYGANKTSLSDWQTSTKQDSNSINIRPSFVDTSVDLTLNTYSPFSCAKILGVDYDIKGLARLPLTSMGCYAPIVPIDGALMSVINWKSPNAYAGDTSHLKVILFNAGTTPITSADIGWKFNNVDRPIVPWTGNLLIGETDTIDLGVVTYISGDNEVSVWIRSLGSLNDPTQANDTVKAYSNACDSMLNGYYTIGETGNFKTIAKAIEAVEYCGISAAVVFEIQNGTYTDPLSIGYIPGSSETNTVTFISQSLDASKVTINVANTALRLNDAAHLNFRYLTFYGNVIGVDIVENCTNVEFYACSLSTSASTLTTYRVVNYANTSTSGKYLKDVRFIQNTLSGGYYSMYLNYAGSSQADMVNSSITIDSNTMIDAYGWGIYSNYYSKYNSISYNTISTRSDAATQYGIDLYLYNTIDKLIGNKITVNSTTTAYGIRLHNYLNSYAATQPALVANNIVSIPQAATAYGVYVSNIKARVYNNTVRTNGSVTHYGLYISAMSSTYVLDAKNNIFATLGTGTNYPIYAAAPSYATQANGTYLDYNDYYSANTNVGYVASAITTMAALRSATGQDNNSINLNPNFVSASDLRLTSHTGFECPRMPEVDRDYRNYIRKNTTSIGAYEKNHSNIDAELVSFVGFNEAYADGNAHPLSVVVRNAGLNSITSTATITGKINNVDITPVTYTPGTSLPYGKSDTVLIGSYLYTSGVNTIMAAISLTGDTIRENDTTQDSRYMCAFIMGGEYTIGSSLSADYPSVDSLLADILRCGINADITLKFENGTYAGSWDLSNLDYFMGGYAIKITSLAANRDSVIFANTSGALVTLNNTHNVEIKHVTLNAQAGTYAVQIIGDASNIVFDNCKILASPTSTTTTSAGIYKATSTGLLQGLTIKNSLIDGGYYGVCLCGTTNEYVQKVTIDSNIVSNQYYHGIYLQYVNSKSTSYNFVTPRSINQGTTWYGIWVNYNRNGGNIIGNRIYSNNSSITTTIHGLNMHYIDSALIANNEIYLNSTANLTYGMYLNYPIASKVLHNSVLITGTSNIA